MMCGVWLSDTNAVFINRQQTTLQVETNLMNSEHDKGVNFSIFQPGPQVFEFLKICPLGETTSNHDTDGSVKE